MKLKKQLSLQSFPSLSLTYLKISCWWCCYVHWIKILHLSIHHWLQLLPVSFFPILYHQLSELLIHLPVEVVSQEK